MDNIVSMSELALANGIQVVLSSVLPTDHFIWNPDVEQIVEKIHHLNQRIIEYCNSRHIPYLDYYTSMTDNSASMIEAYTDDGVHPTSAGYEVMEAKLLDTLETVNLTY